jgi:hypothetical protein
MEEREEKEKKKRKEERKNKNHHGEEGFPKGWTRLTGCAMGQSC